MYVETLIVMAALFDIEQRFHNSLDLRNDFFFLFLTNNVVVHIVAVSTVF